MSRIDRRMFALGCLLVPLVGCGQDHPRGFTGASAGIAPPQGIRFLNDGRWQQSGDAQIFVVTGPIPG